jgi:uncharacterized protein (TIGR02646 family)
VIHIDRERADEHGRPIRPDAAWFEKSAAARRDALREGAAHEPRDSVYAHLYVKAALEKLFHDKCAYCETSLTAAPDWDVEHFRPKGKVAERDDHPGYYWLAYEWTNLYPSCKPCNQRRRDPPRWGDLRFAGTAGKAHQFPLGNETTRALAPEDDLDREDRLLLDPCGADRPGEHLRFSVDGQVVPVAGSRMGQATVEVFHLRRRRLRDQRRQKIEAVIYLLKLIGMKEQDGDADGAMGLQGFLEKYLLADEREYAAAARAVLADPALFGL